MNLKYVPIERIFFLNSWRKMIEKVNEIDLKCEWKGRVDFR